jgi:RNA polymerase sigma factor (sigma-70 family)
MLTDSQASRALIILRGMAARSHCASEDREDVVQEALLRLVEYGPVLDAGLEFMCSWAINAPAQRSYQRMRSRDSTVRKEVNRTRGLGREKANDESATSRVDAVDAIATAARTACLSEVEKRILDRLLAGEKYSEIAKALNISSASVNKRVNGIRSKFCEFVRLGLL